MCQICPRSTCFSTFVCDAPLALNSKILSSSHIEISFPPIPNSNPSPLWLSYSNIIIRNRPLQPKKLNVLNLKKYRPNSQNLRHKMQPGLIWNWSKRNQKIRNGSYSLHLWSTPFSLVCLSIHICLIVVTLFTSALWILCMSGGLFVSSIPESGGNWVGSHYVSISNVLEEKLIGCFPLGLMSTLWQVNCERRYMTTWYLWLFLPGTWKDQTL